MPSTRYGSFSVDRSNQPLLATPGHHRGIAARDGLHGLCAGEATVTLYTRLLDELHLDDEVRGALLDDYAIYIPRLVRS